MTYGGSTGGWESLAWQIFYPDHLNGTWTFCPDPVDFRYFQMVDIYKDDNAFYPNSEWKKTPVRPWSRGLDDQTQMSQFDASRYEEVLGHEGAVGRTDGHLHGRVRPRRTRRLSEAPLRQVDRRHRPERSPSTGASTTTCATSSSATGRRSARSWSARSTSSWATRTRYLLEEAMFKLQAFLESTKDPYYAGSFDIGKRQPHCYSGTPEFPGQRAEQRYHSEDDRTDADDRAGRRRPQLALLTEDDHGTQDGRWFHPEVLLIFDQYVHGDIDRRTFLAGRQVRRRWHDGGRDARRTEPALCRGAADRADDARLEAEYREVRVAQGPRQGARVPGAAGEGKGPLPLVLVVHENRGLNPHIEDVARGAWPSRTSSPSRPMRCPARRLPRRRGPGARAVPQARSAQGVRGLHRRRRFLKKPPECTGKVGVVASATGRDDHLLGHRLPNLAAAAPFYGNQASAEDAAKRLQQVL